MFKLGDMIEVNDHKSIFDGSFGHIIFSINKGLTYDYLVDMGQSCKAWFPEESLFKVDSEINKCECGAEKTNQPEHSQWCDMFKMDIA